MSTDYDATALIGVRVPVERLYREKRIRTCDHALPSDAAYCPTCGKPAHQLEAEPIYDDMRDSLGGLDVVFGTDQKYAIVGLLSSKTRRYDQPGYIDLPSDLMGVYERIDRVLAEYGMADIRQKEPIGLYSVLYCSH